MLSRGSSVSSTDRTKVRPGTWQAHLHLGAHDPERRAPALRRSQTRYTALGRALRTPGIRATRGGRGGRGLGGGGRGGSYAVLSCLSLPPCRVWCVPFLGRPLVFQWDCKRRKTKILWGDDAVSGYFHIVYALPSAAYFKKLDRLPSLVRRLYVLRHSRTSFQRTPTPHPHRTHTLTHTHGARSIATVPATAAAVQHAPLQGAPRRWGSALALATHVHVRLYLYPRMHGCGHARRCCLSGSVQTQAVCLRGARPRAWSSIDR